MRTKIGHDLLTLTSAATCVFDSEKRLLFGKDAETVRWTLPGGTIDPEELPATAAVRECWEKSRLHFELTRLIGIIGGPEFVIIYPNGDQAYCTTVAFEARSIGGILKADGSEITDLQYFSAADCRTLNILPSARVVSTQALKRQNAHTF